MPGNPTGEVFFLTVCCEPRGKNQLANDEVWEVLADSLEVRQKRGNWDCRLFLAMPDHVHLLAMFEGERRMERVVGQWKRWVATRAGVKWQRDFFEHRLRTNESAVEKVSYILDNPVRAGLVGRREDWAFVWRPEG